MTGVSGGSEIRSEAADARPDGRIVLFQKLDASSRKFDDVPDGRVARPGDAVRCGSHHMDCLSAQSAFQQGDRASSPEIDSGSSVTGNVSAGMPIAQEPLPGVKGRPLPGAGHAGAEGGVGIDRDPAMSSGCPLKSLMSPSLDPAPHGLRGNLFASRMACRRHPRIASCQMFWDCSSRKARNVAFVAW